MSYDIRNPQRWRNTFDKRFKARAGAPIPAGIESSYSSMVAADSTSHAQSTATSSAAATSQTSSAPASSSAAPQSSSVDSSAPPSSAATSQTTTQTSQAPSPSAATPTAAPTTDVNTPTTLSGLSTTQQLTSTAYTTISTSSTTSKPISIVTGTSSALPNSNLETKTTLSTPAIAGIVVAGVAAVVAVIIFIVVKRKQNRRRRYRRKARPIDFKSANDGLGSDAFIEKKIRSSPSHKALESQRQEFVADLTTPEAAVPGVPEHDFTPGAYDYNTDPYNQPYNYDAQYNQQYQSYPPDGHYDPTAAYHYDQPTQDAPPMDQYGSHDHYQQQQGGHDQGYTDLRRGPSANHGQMYQEDHNYGIPRPTAGSDGPYAQAAAYRQY